MTGSRFYPGQWVIYEPHGGRAQSARIYQVRQDGLVELLNGLAVTPDRLSPMLYTHGVNPPVALSLEAPHSVSVKASENMSLSQEDKTRLSNILAYLKQVERDVNYILGKGEANG